MSAEIKKIDVSDYEQVEAQMLAKAHELARTIGHDNDNMLGLLMHFACHVFALGCQHERATIEAKQTASE